MSQQTNNSAATSKPSPARPRIYLAMRAGGVLLAAIALVAAVAVAGKWATVERLVARIRTADDATAGRLVRELAEFGDTAYPALVVAAGSERSAVALASRQQIDRLVDDWQQQARLEPASFALDGQALPLARAIADELSGFTANGRRWARKVLMSLVDLAQQQNFDDRLALLRVCDIALSSLPADDPPLAFDADVNYRLTLAPPSFPPQSTGEQFVSQPRSVQLGPPRPVESQTLPASEPQASSDAVQTRSVAQPDTRSEPSAAPLAEWKSSWTAQQVPAASMRRVPAQSASTTRRPEPPLAVDDTGEGETNAAREQLAKLQAELALFNLLATGDAETQAAAAKALEVRGYGFATPRDARMLLSPSSADRLALVSLAMTSSRLEAGTWLWRLAHDASGEVRAAAIAGISTSDNRQLINAAIEHALRDTDPRVAEQAARMRETLR